MNILSVGQFSADGISNTCLHRNWALKKIGTVNEIDTTISKNRLIYRIVNRLFVKYRISIGIPSHSLNNRILKTLRERRYDFIWIDKGIRINASTLKLARQLQSDVLIVGYSPDNMAERHNQSRNFLKSLPLYDYYITTKSYTIEALRNMGCKNVLFVNNAYEDTFHFPYAITPQDRVSLGGKVGFIGQWESERCQSILFLAENGIPVRVWGGGKWLEYKNRHPNLIIESCGLFSEDYHKALSAFDISLCFLRKINSDLQTTRTMEIPACGSLLMAERTAEHEKLFVDGKEAVFFSTDDELLDRCRYYLEHENERLQVVQAGRERCVRSGYSNYETIRSVIRQIVKENPKLNIE